MTVTNNTHNEGCELKCRSRGTWSLKSRNNRLCVQLSGTAFGQIIKGPGSIPS